jgi:uncharacterized protein YbjT (DUF2867 family)
MLMGVSSNNAGQLVIASLLERGEYTIRAVVRDVDKAKSLFGEENMEKIQVHEDSPRVLEILCARILFSYSTASS